VNLRRGVDPAETRVAGLAGAGSLALEFTLLSHLAPPRHPPSEAGNRAASSQEAGSGSTIIIIIIISSSSGGGGGGGKNATHLSGGGDGGDGSSSGVTSGAAAVGDDRFGCAARGALLALWARRHPVTGLVGKHVDAGSGRWVEEASGIGSTADSFYE